MWNIIGKEGVTAIPSLLRFSVGNSGAYFPTDFLLTR